MNDAINNFVNNKSIDTYKIIESKLNILERYLIIFFKKHDFMLKEDMELILQSIENKTYKIVDLYNDSKILESQPTEMSDEVIK